MKKYFTVFFVVFFTTYAVYSQNSKPLYATNEVYIKLKPNTKSSDVKKSSPAVNVAQELPFLSNHPFVVLQATQPFFYSTNNNLLKTYRIKFKEGTDVSDVMSALKNDTNIDYVEPIPIYKLDYLPNDPSLNSQYHLGKIKAYEAWDITKGGINIPVAIVDDAVQINHPDIAANVIPGWDVVDNDNDPSPSSTSYSHGTHVAGIVGAVSDNGIGIASVGMNKAKIMGVRCSNSPGYITHGYEGIAWAANHGAKIINMSWGGAGFSSTAQEVINDASNLGVILVAAAGNNSSNSLHYPSAYDNVVAVASTTSTDALSYFTNYGTWVDICAPGSDIYSTVPFNTYDTYSGTSMASPLTAGALAFIWSVKSTLSSSDVVNLLKINADNINSQNPSYVGQLGAGRINLQRAINCTDFQASVTPLGPLVLCNSGSNFTLTANTVNGATYQWLKNNATVSGSISTTLEANTAGSYAVAITKNNCTLTSTPVEISLAPSSISITSNRNPATLCNDSLILSAPNIAGISYQWKRDEANIVGATNYKLTTNQAGTYKVTISAAGCTAVTSNEILVDGVSLFISPNGSIVLCEGESETLTIPSYPSAINQWKKNNAFIGSNTNSLTVNQAGVYTAIVTTTACGSKTSSAVSVGVIPSSITISSSGSPIICGPNSSVTLSVLNIVGAKYQWKRNGVNIGTNTNTFVATLAGIYTVSISKIDDSCLVNSSPITIEAIGNVSITPVSPITLCTGESVTLRTTPVSGATFNWKKDGVSIGFGTDTLKVTESGTYTLTLFKNSCIVDSPSTLVSIIPSSINITSSSSTLICQGSSISLETVALQGLNYQWKRNGVNVGNNSSRHTTTLDGLYTVNISKSGSLCSTISDTIAVTVIQNNLNITPNESTTVCAGDSTLLTGNVISGASYQWLKNNVNVAGATSRMYNAKTTGFYQLKATVLSCDFYSNIDTVKVYSTQSAAPINPINVTICEGETVSPLSISAENCPAGSVINANYTGPTVGYDAGYQSDVNPKINIVGGGNGITDIKVIVTWEKKDQGSYNTCSSSHAGGSPYLNEMRLQLKSPTGTIVTLVPTEFFSGNYQGIITTTFSSIGQNMTSTPQTGTFKPYESLTPFISTNPNGIWELIGYDSAGSDPLCISGFSLEINIGGSGQAPKITWWSSPTAKTGRLTTGTNYTPTQTVPGTYTFYAQTECGFSCPSNRVPVTLTIKAKAPTPIITAKINGNTTVSPATICSGQSIVLTANGCTGTVLWSDNSTGTSITVTPTGTTSYTAICQVSSPLLCSPSLQSSAFNLSVNPANLLIINDIPTNTNQVFVAENIQAKSIINTPSRIEYKGSKAVSLEAGFSITGNSGTSFKAYIGNCPN